MIRIVFAPGVNIAPGVVAALDDGEGGVWVALICFFTLAGEGVFLPNSLLKPKCIEQDESSNVKNTINETTAIFFISPPSIGHNLIPCQLMKSVVG